MGQAQGEQGISLQLSDPCSEAILTPGKAKILLK